ncbi:MAG: SPOR domain-containing protein [Fibrobacter sp.]|nr:SPOR domain-containing protein [Fibrobacter sp.]
MRLFAKVLFASLTTLAISASAATLEDAQKAYVSGNWKGAAEAFEAVCPTLDLSKRSECALWGVLARSQTGNSKDFSAAKKRLDSLIFATPDSLPVVSDLYMTRAQFELYLKRPDLSYKSLKASFAKARPNQLAVIYQVCQSLYKVSTIDSVHSFCAEIERTKTSPIASSTSTASSSSAQADSVIASSSSALSSAAEPISSASEVLSSAAEVAPAPVAEAAPAGDWSLQLGAFSIQANAEMLANSLKAKKIDARVIEAKHDDRTLYLVQTGAFANRDEAMKYGEEVLSKHHLEYTPVKKL